VSTWSGRQPRGGGQTFCGEDNGDISSHVTGILGARHRDRVVGIYTHHPNLDPVLDGAAVKAREAARATGPDVGMAQSEPAETAKVIVCVLSPGRRNVTPASHAKPWRMPVQGPVRMAPWSVTVRPRSG